MMSEPLPQLIFWGFRGRIVHFGRMLKHPAYLLGFLAGVAWLLFWLGPVILGSQKIDLGDFETVARSFVRFVPAFHILASFGLALALSVWWLMQWGSQPLGFQQAEIHLLLPAPLTRRDLLQYATLKNQPRILLGCLFLTFFLGGARRGYFLALCTYWLLLTNWDLHAKARNLWISRNKELPTDWAWRRRVLLVGALLAYWSVFIWIAYGLVPSIIQIVGRSETIFEAVDAFSAAIWQSGLWFLLSPAWLFLAPQFSMSLSAVFLSGVLLNLGLVLLHNEWVVRSAFRFEEAALRKARQEAQRARGVGRYVGASLRSRKRVPCSLRWVRSPETAVIWKNLIASNRMPLRQQISIGILSVTGLYLALVVLPLPGWIYAVFLITGLVLFFFFPMFAGNGYRNDFRTDLTNLEMVRSWPTAAWRMFVAEIGGPSLQIGLYAALGAGISIASQLAIDSTGVEELKILPDGLLESTTLPAVLVLSWVLLGLAPFVILTGAMCCAMHNLLALNFPGWVPLGRRRQDAAANLGQNLLITLVIMFGMGAGILPSALLLGVLLRIQFWFGIPFSFWEMPLLGCLISLPILSLLTLMVILGGWSWTRLDPSRELFLES